MDDIQPVSLLDKLKLADAFWQLWAAVFPDQFVHDFFRRHRGRCYEKDLTFPHLVSIVADALTQRAGSAHKVLADAAENDELPVSMAAVYGKIRRLPLALSEAWLKEGTERLRPLLPKRPAGDVPLCLQPFSVVIFDGKTFKRAAKRLKTTRDCRGKGLGGRALVGLELKTGLIVAMTTHPDGYANEASLVADLLPPIRQSLPGPRVWVADRQFGDLPQMRRLLENGDHFVLRLHKKTAFFPDPAHPPAQGVDVKGRRFTEQRGSLQSKRQAGKGQPPLEVRQITLHRPGQEDLVVVTDLLEAATYPATELLDLYRRRWGIEQVFQQITEVFHLDHLIGCTPKAVIFQGAFCMLIYNVLQVVKAQIADVQERSIGSLSTHNIFDDLQRQLSALHLFVPVRSLSQAILKRSAEVASTPEELVAYLRERLGQAWTKRWIKSPPKKPSASPPKPKSSRGGHFSIQRAIDAARE
jgi:Transposase DDE domain